VRPGVPKSLHGERTLSPAVPTGGRSRGAPRLFPALSWVAVCLVASGALVYAYMAVIARSLPTTEYGWFGAYWSLCLVIGFGAFLPVEFELTRLVHLRQAGAPLPSETPVVLATLTVASSAVVVAAWPLLSDALGGRPGMLWALLAVCVVSAAQFTLRGLLLGRGHPGWHGGVLLIDSGLRVTGAVAVAAAIVRPTAVEFGWTLVVAIALSHIPLLLVLARSRRRPPRPPSPELRLRIGAVGTLMLGTLSAQALLNAAPILVNSAAGPGEGRIAAAFVAGFTLIRLPLFVAVPLQSALIPALTEVGTTADRGAQRRLVLRLLGAVAGVGLAAAALAALVGPPVIALLFGSRYTLPGLDLGILAAGSIAYLGLLVMTQALVATAKHRASALAWVSGLAAAGLVFATVPELVARVALAFGLGSLVGLAVATTALLRRQRAPSALDGLSR
jgi:O-antigen/teichoic acid export membrane protein